MRKASLVPIIVISVILGGTTPLFGQITITSSNIENVLNRHVTMEVTGDYTSTVDLGSSGGPQTWDFRSIVTPISIEADFVDPDSTPYAGEFPTSNFASKIEQNYEADFHYEYSRVESDMFSFLGMVIEFPDSINVRRWESETQAPLPLAMGSSWTYNHRWDEQGDHMEERGRVEVEAWGTMLIPYGTFETLRAVIYDTTTTTSMDSSFIETTITIQYQWWSEEFPYVILVYSTEGETNPNFTTADAVIRIRDMQPPVGIGDGNGVDVLLPRAFRLEQNSPNPFNPQTTITYSVPEESDGDTELSVFSIRGRKVRTLVSSQKRSGNYTVSWNGRDESGRSLPSGVYFYRLVTGGETLTRKMILAK
jgi:hypothetical protein